MLEFTLLISLFSFCKVFFSTQIIYYFLHIIRLKCFILKINIKIRVDMKIYNKKINLILFFIIFSLLIN